MFNIFICSISVHIPIYSDSLSWQRNFANLGLVFTHHVLRLLVIDEELELGLDVHPGEVALHLEPLAAGQLERNARDLRRHRGRLWVIQDKLE